jgi:hypothetical protein
MMPTPGTASRGAAWRRWLLGQLALEAIQDPEVVQRPAGRIDRRVQLVEQPAQAALQPRALDDQVGSVIEQQRDLALGP